MDPMTSPSKATVIIYNVTNIFFFMQENYFELGTYYSFFFMKQIVSFSENKEILEANQRWIFMNKFVLLQFFLTMMVIIKERYQLPVTQSLSSLNHFPIHMSVHSHNLFSFRIKLKGRVKSCFFPPFNPENMVRTSPHVLIRSGGPEVSMQYNKIDI